MRCIVVTGKKVKRRRNFNPLQTHKFTAINCNWGTPTQHSTRINSQKRSHSSTEDDINNFIYCWEENDKLRSKSELKLYNDTVGNNIKFSRSHLILVLFIFNFFSILLVFVSCSYSLLSYYQTIINNFQENVIIFLFLFLWDFFSVFSSFCGKYNCIYYLVLILRNFRKIMRKICVVSLSFFCLVSFSFETQQRNCMDLQALIFGIFILKGCLNEFHKSCLSHI